VLKKSVMEKTTAVMATFQKMRPTQMTTVLCSVTMVFGPWTAMMRMMCAILELLSCVMASTTTAREMQEMRSRMRTEMG
jgi:hypothetical protein